MAQKASKKVSPIKSKRARRAGEGLDDALWQIRRQNVIAFGVLTFIFGLILGYVIPRLLWVQGFFLFSLFAGSIWLFRWDKRTDKLIENLRLGREGEEAVGEALDALQAVGARIIHDLQCGAFNIDHVVLHPAGVFAIETKTRSREDKKWSNLSFDGKNVLLNDKPVEPNPVRQAIGQAVWLNKHLKAAHGEDFFVKSIIVYPGWTVTWKGSHKHVKVMGLAAMTDFFQKPKTAALLPADIARLHAKILAQQASLDPSDWVPE